MDENNKKKAKKLLLLSKDAPLAIMDELEQINTTLETIATKPDMEMPPHPTTMEVTLPGIALVTLKGEPGIPGEPGKNYILTDEDKMEIALAIDVPVVEKLIEKTEVIREQPIVTENVTNQIVEVAVAEPADKIRDKLETLKEDARLDVSAIKGITGRLSKFGEDLLNRAIGILDQRTSFLIQKVSNLSDRVSSFITTVSGTYVPYTGATTNVNLGNNDLNIGTELTQTHVLTVSLGNAGTGYTALDILTLSTGGANATVRVNSVTGGVIDDVTLLNGGTGYSVATSAVTGGSGSSATINILTVGTSTSPAQFQINQPLVPTKDVVRYLSEEGYLHFGIDSDGRFAVGGPTTQFTVFDRAVQASNASDTLDGYTWYVVGNVLYINSNNTGLDVFSLANGGKMTITGAFTGGVSVLTDTATPALDASLGNTFTLTATGNRTIAVPTNPVDGQNIFIRHTASGGARTLSLNTGAGGFRFTSNVTSIPATASGKVQTIGCKYNSTDGFWDVLAEGTTS